MSNLIDVEIGKYSYTGVACSMNNVIIGNFCSIASYCSIGGDRHPLQSLSTSPHFYNSGKFSLLNNIVDNPMVVIGSDVWIGEKVFIKSGIKIGNGAIIGAHSVVTKDVPDFSIVAGVPSMIIGYRFGESVIDFLNESEWWNLNDDDLRNFIINKRE